MPRHVRIVRPRWKEAKEVGHRALAKTVQKVAQAIEGHAAVEAPVDTGNLMASVYSETARDSGRERAHASVAAHGLEAAVVEITIADDLSAKVAAAAHYGTYVELGTDQNPANPFMGRAVDRVEPQIDRILSTSFKEEVAKA